MAQVGGWLSDYDLINVGFEPRPLNTPQGIRLFCKHVPCLVFGAPEQYTKCALRFINDRAESDMQWFDEHVGTYETSQTVTEYSPRVNFPLVHFSHAACKGRLRSEVIKEWMESKEVIKELEAGKVDRRSYDEAIAKRIGSIPALDSPLTPIHGAPTIVGQFRFHIQAIKKVMGDSQSRRIVFHDELRKAGLLGKVKVPKPSKKPRKKWFVKGKK